MPKAGDVVLTKVQFTDTFEFKKRPALVLFEEFDNVVVAGITSNLEMEGIPLTKKEGAIKDSVIKIEKLETDFKNENSKLIENQNKIRFRVFCFASCALRSDRRNVSRAGCETCVR